MKKALLILLSTLMLFAFASCDGRYIPTPKNGYVEIKEDTTVEDINKIIEDLFTEGIWSENNVVIKMGINDKITINRNFGFQNVTFEAELPENQTDSPSGNEENSLYGIEITENGSKVTFDHVIFRNYTHAVTIGGSQNNVEITGSTFVNCFNGISASGIGNLYVINTTMKGSEMDSGINIDQTAEGGKISITNSNFTNFDGNTAGAIKISYDTGGSFKSVNITENTFSQNRKDVVIGTDNDDVNIAKTTYPETLAENTTIQDCELEDNSGNGYVIENGKLIIPAGINT